MEHGPKNHRIRPLEAWRAVRTLFANPEDTGQVFVIIDALTGKSGLKIFDRFRADAVGARILAERRSLLDKLSDRAALEALPQGTLGRIYADFVAREQLTADGLVEASLESDSSWMSEGRRLFADRLRDMHDLWHVVTGYGRDLIGEAALLAFSYAQTRNRGVGFIVLMSWIQAENNEERRLIVEGFRRGRRAAWLPAADWEGLLSLPLEDVRRELRVGAASHYEPIRSAGAPQVAY
jgi:ubiquinone biosynthesis protein COQ4